MPIYEFYCSDCHTLFSFLARTPDTTKRPPCPRCDRPRLERRASAFAIASASVEPGDDASMPEGPDPDRLERTMAELARDAEGLDDDNPRQMARMMRKLFDRTGMQFGPGMEEAMRRLETGEDPDKIEEEMGDALEGEEEALFGVAGESGPKGGLRRLCISIIRQKACLPKAISR